MAECFDLLDRIVDFTSRLFQLGTYCSELIAGDGRLVALRYCSYSNTDDSVSCIDDDR